jgi:hypothetical protein
MVGVGLVEGGMKSQVKQHWFLAPVKIAEGVIVGPIAGPLANDET